MPFPPPPKSILLFTALVSSVACEASCWPDLLEQEGRVHMAYDRVYYETSRARKEREKLRDELRKCPEDADLFYALPPDHVKIGTYSLLSMAVIADDPELVRKFAERLHHDTPPDSNELMYAGEHVAVATYFESEMALDELLRMGMSATETASGDWETPLYTAQVYTATGLRMIRRLVDEGADVNAASTNGHTSIEAAAWQGDLLKVQCLFVLGATLPAPVDTEKLSRFRSFDAVLETNSFLQSEDRKLLPQVTEICSFDGD